MRGRVVTLARHPDRLPGPLNRQPLDHPGHHRIRTGIAKEHQVVGGNHFVSDRSVIDHPNPPAEPLVELATETIQRPACPVSLRLRPGGPGATDTDKRPHERVVDWPLEIPPLVEIDVLLKVSRAVVVQNVPVLAGLLVIDSRQKSVSSRRQPVTDTVDLDSVGHITRDLKSDDIPRSQFQRSISRPGRLHDCGPIQLPHFLDRQPLADVVLDRPGDETDIGSTGIGATPLESMVLVECHELLERIGVKPVSGPRANQQLDRHAQPLGS